MSEQDDLEGWPRWLHELDQALVTRPQIVLHGNVRDLVMLPTSDGPVEYTVVDAVVHLLTLRGAVVVQWDPTGRLSMAPAAGYASIRPVLSEVEGHPVMAEKPPPSVDRETFLFWIEGLSGARSLPASVVIDYASRLTTNPNELDEDQRKFFLRCLRASHAATSLRRAAAGGPPTYNPVIWIADKVEDLPAWLLVGNSRIRPIAVPMPDHDARTAMARAVLPGFPGADRMGRRELEAYSGRFADLTDRMPLRALREVYALSRRYDLPPTEITEAIRRYRVGLPDNPWTQTYLRERIGRAAATLRESVAGQDDAVEAAAAILTRAYMGLSGAQSPSQSTRPRGIMFFAGPTGVGKTELAKSITRLLFKDEQACIRFDMSEFSAEHAEARLIGAPPGYVGYETGGELVNAVRQRPFSVLLFDEIEKANPRILDKFLQILEDGRLTDGRGDTAHFSESVLVFTSNLGIYSEVAGEKVLNVSPEDPPETVRARILDAIKDHFRRAMGRPELLNRFGDNIIVFDFIRPQVAARIAERMLANVLARVHATTRIEVTLSEAARRALLARATDDASNGGRGIGNRIETLLINPLATALFAGGVRAGGRAEVQALADDGGRPRLVLG